MTHTGTNKERLIDERTYLYQHYGRDTGKSAMCGWYRIFYNSVHTRKQIFREKIEDDCSFTIEVLEFIVYIWKCSLLIVLWWPHHHQPLAATKNYLNYWSYNFPITFPITYCLASIECKILNYEVIYLKESLLGLQNCLLFSWLLNRIE